ncbi:acyl dehydratase [Flexivirga endophytica]|uniref:Acyl dehydratase n=1 Tax=Flexivirga endophytica TaxID=1849103 RepID=A0A916T7D1_9MICO|nr:MaoC/PaaZ C-terminal domain-containing protein [Flexivirga endophytica]GGB34481.1 acyl dehydratase [Flexivirga endophytica]GHB42416.1 acyl dehydratase [Flexivirga endophytica]
MLLSAEDLPVGNEIDCGSYEVTDGDARDFAAQWDPQYFHVDPERAGDSEFGGLIASGLHTMSIYQRLVVTAVYQRYDVIAGRAFRHVKFLRPVRAGDVLHCSATVRSVTPDGPGRCAVVVDGRLRNQHGKPVLELELDCLVRSRHRTPAH